MADLKGKARFGFTANKDGVIVVGQKQPDPKANEPDPKAKAKTS